MKASIDIGTNTVLLLVAETDGKTLTVIDEQQRIPRLGAGVDESKNLSESAMYRVIGVLQEYQQIVKEKYPSVSNMYVTATSAVRDANNKKQFLTSVEHETALSIQVLSGFEEAQYTFAGAPGMLSDELSGNQNVVIDIGGGSTEIASGGDTIRDRFSFDMGCVRFTERYLRDDPPTESQLELCKVAIQNELYNYDFNFGGHSQLIGVAGTVTSLAYIDKQLDSYKGKLLSGHRLSLNDVHRYITNFKQYSSSKLEKRYPEVLKGRADIFLVGLLILKEVMERYNFEALTTSTGGIRHGTLLVKAN